MSSRMVVRAALLGGALAAVPAAIAAEPLSLPQALARAAAHHPDLQGFPDERAALEARRSLAGRSPPAEAGLLLEDALGSGSRSGLDASQWTLSFSQALELAGQRAGRLALVASQQAALDSDQRQRRRQRLAEVAEAFIEAAADAERLKLAEQQLELARKNLEAATARVASARAPIAEKGRARAAVARALLEREHAEHEERSARVALAVGMGQEEPDFDRLEARLFELPPLQPLEDLQAAIDDSPAAKARLAGVAVHEAEARAALSAAGWRPTVSGGIRRYDDGDDIGLLLGVTLPLGQQRRARDEAAAANALAAQSGKEHRASLLSTHSMLFERYQEIGHAREAFRLLDREVVPALDEALQQTQIAYDRGRYGYLELAQVASERAVAMRERLDTAARYHSLLADLERLTGETLIEGSQP